MIIRIRRNNIYNTKIRNLLFIGKDTITLYGTSEVVPSIEIDTHFPLLSIKYKDKKITLSL